MVSGAGDKKSKRDKVCGVKIEGAAKTCATIRNGHCLLAGTELFVLLPDDINRP